MIDDTLIQAFQESVWNYYHDNGRHDLPWRQPDVDGSFDPYKIMVSEIMLQQTQVARVLPKYHEFLAAFPSVELLAQASLGEVLRLWSGLGYNRRAKFLHQAAQCINQEHQGKFPKNIDGLVELPGIGVNTAGAILAYAFNQPVMFVETNIRTVYIHHFFNDKFDVSDKELRVYIERTLDREQPREWYWALMDYGAYLKRSVGNVSRQSKHHTVQSAFHGSRRQVRGQILKELRDHPQSFSQLEIAIADARLLSVLTDLENEQLITKSEGSYRL